MRQSLNTVESVRDTRRQQKARVRTTAAGEATFVKGGRPSLSYERLRHQAGIDEGLGLLDLPNAMHHPGAFDSKF